MRHLVKVLSPAFTRLSAGEARRFSRLKAGLRTLKNLVYELLISAKSYNLITEKVAA